MNPGQKLNKKIRSENEFLCLVDKYFPNFHHCIHLGRGDDCAELSFFQENSFELVELIILANILAVLNNEKNFNLKKIKELFKLTDEALLTTLKPISLNILLDLFNCSGGFGSDLISLIAPSVSLSSDLFLEDIHFRTSYFTAEEIGYKALAVNLSDLSACGARPLGFSLCLMLPQNTDRDYVESLIKGISLLSKEHDIPLVGGDLSRAPCLGFSITIWGRKAVSNFKQIKLNLLKKIRKHLALSAIDADKFDFILNFSQRLTEINAQVKTEEYIHSKEVIKFNNKDLSEIILELSNVFKIIKDKSFLRRAGRKNENISEEVLEKKVEKKVLETFGLKNSKKNEDNVGQKNAEYSEDELKDMQFNFLTDKYICQPDDILFLVSVVNCEQRINLENIQEMQNQDILSYNKKVNKQKQKLSLGLARIGLLALEEWGREKAENLFPEAVLAHLKPVPLIKAGLFLVEQGNMALMDLSDGLIRDLPRLIACDDEEQELQIDTSIVNYDNIGVSILISEQDLTEDLIKYCQLKKENPVIQAVIGGEEYALLGVCSPKTFRELVEKTEDKNYYFQIKALGTIIKNIGIYINNKEWNFFLKESMNNNKNSFETRNIKNNSVNGFDHFSE